MHTHKQAIKGKRGVTSSSIMSLCSTPQHLKKQQQTKKTLVTRLDLERTFLTVYVQTKSMTETFSTCVFFQSDQFFWGVGQRMKWKDFLENTRMSEFTIKLQFRAC